MAMQRRAKRQVGISTPRQMATCTRTLGAVGSKPEGVPIEDGANRRRVARQPSVEGVGTPGWTVLVVRKAAVVVAAGVVVEAVLVVVEDRVRL